MKKLITFILLAVSILSVEIKAQSSYGMSLGSAEFKSYANPDFDDGYNLNFDIIFKKTETSRSFFKAGVAMIRGYESRGMDSNRIEFINPNVSIFGELLNIEFNASEIAFYGGPGVYFQYYFRESSLREANKSEFYSGFVTGAKLEGGLRYSTKEFDIFLFSTVGSSFTNFFTADNKIENNFNNHYLSLFNLGIYKKL